MTYTATDIHGNTTSSTFDVTVEDNEDPTITDMPADTTTYAGGGCSADVTWTEPTGADNCTLSTLTSDVTSGATFNLGTTTVTYTATDGAGNFSTASFNVTVLDTISPTISDMPGDITQAMDADSCHATVNWTAPTANDNCSVTLTSSHTPGSAFTSGTTTVTYTATDGSGNTTTASFTVTVTDDEDPEISNMPSNITQTANAGVCMATVTWTEPTDSDNCSSTLTSTHSPGDAFAVGTTTVTYTATDLAGNSATASFNITVTDDEAPAFGTLLNDTVSTDLGSCDAVVTFTDPTVTDNCAVATLTSDIASGSTFSLGSTTVTYTATDIHGNTTSATFDVVVEDNEGPTISPAAQDTTTECDLSLIHI